MGIYTKDALKEITPNETVRKCIDLFEEYNFKEITRSLIIMEERQEKFGAFSGNFVIDPYGLYQHFPDKFPYLEGKEYINSESSNGKGLSLDQCIASLFIEMFERLSIHLFEQKTKAERGEIIKSFTGDSYANYLKEEAPYLYDHFHDKRFVYKLMKDEFDHLKIRDLKSDDELYFPSYVLYDSMGTNGFTAGNSYEEAVFGGIFEIVERHTQTLFCTNELSGSRISLDSIIENVPELKDMVSKCSEFFDEYDVADISITINNVKFYSYCVRVGYKKTNYRQFAAGGCSLDQRIALIRAITESIQSFHEEFEDAGNTVVRKQGWNARMFSNFFIDEVYNKIGNLKEVPLQLHQTSFNSIHEIYEKAVAPFEHVFVLDCTNENFNIPAAIIYIPELFPKTYIWPAIFNVGKSNFLGTIIPENIEGIEKLFFWESEMLSSKEEHERKKAYLRLIGRLSNNSVNSFIQKKYSDYKPDDKQQLQKEITPYDSMDPDSFIYFNNNSNIDYQFESFARIGCIELCKPFLSKVSNTDLIKKYIEKYDQLGEHLLDYDEYERALVVYKQLVEITDNPIYQDKLNELNEIYDTASNVRNSIYNQDEPMILGIKLGDTIEGFRLKNIIEEGMFQFELQFDNDGSVFNVTLYTLEPDDYYSRTKKDVYIDHLHGLLLRKEKKFMKKLLKQMNAFKF